MCFRVMARKSAAFTGAKKLGICHQKEREFQSEFSVFLCSETKKLYIYTEIFRGYNHFITNHIKSAEK